MVFWINWLIVFVSRTRTSWTFFSKTDKPVKVSWRMENWSDLFCIRASFDPSDCGFCSSTGKLLLRQPTFGRSTPFRSSPTIPYRTALSSTGYRSFPVFCTSRFPQHAVFVEVSCSPSFNQGSGLDGGFPIAYYWCPCDSRLFLPSSVCVRFFTRSVLCVCDHRIITGCPCTRQYTD